MKNGLIKISIFCCLVTLVACGSGSGSSDTSNSGDAVGAANSAADQTVVARINAANAEQLGIASATGVAQAVQYQQAPEAIKKATLLVKSKGISFSACLKVCRALKQGKSITAAAQSALYKSATIPAKSKTKAEAVKSVKGHVKRILEHTQLPAAFRTELKKLAAEYDVLQTS